jgi:Protein of unknown function (DUF4254)
MDTVGNLIDKLSIVNIRIWFAEDIKRNKGATDKQLADACRVTNVANSQRNDLIQEIDEMLNRMITTGELQKLYKQGATKMYGRDLAGSAPPSSADPPPPAAGPETT